MRHMILLMLSSLFAFALMACGGPSDNDTPIQRSYADFDHIDHWDDLDRLEGEKSILYYYSPTCHVCIAMKDEVLGLLWDLREDREIYLVNAGFMHEQGTPPMESEAVPALIIFHDGVFTEHILGSTPVLDYLDNERDATD